MQKQHSNWTFSETIRYFCLNGHFFRKNVMGWLSLTRCYKDTNSAQVTCFIIVNFCLDIFFISFFLFLLYILFFKVTDRPLYHIPVTKIIILRKMFWNSWVFLFYLKVSPPFMVITYYFLLNLMPAKTIDRSIPIIIKWS